MSKFSRRCCKIAICPLKIFDVFLVCICFVVPLAFHFLRKKQKLPTFPKILGFGTSLLVFFRVFLKYLCVTYLQKILHKNSNLEIHLYMLVFHSKQLFLSHGSVAADLVVLFLMLPSTLLIAEQCYHQNSGCLC